MASRMASQNPGWSLFARGVSNLVSQLEELCSSTFASPGLGIGRAAAEQIASTKTPANSIQIVTLNQIPKMTPGCALLERCYFNALRLLHSFGGDGAAFGGIAAGGTFRTA